MVLLLVIWLRRDIFASKLFYYFLEVPNMDGKAVEEVGMNHNELKNCFTFSLWLFSLFLPSLPEIAMRIDSLHKKN